MFLALSCISQEKVFPSSEFNNLFTLGRCASDCLILNVQHRDQLHVQEFHTSSSITMGEVGEGKSMSYAAIVSPGGGATPSPGAGGQPEAAVEAKEVVAEEAQHHIDDDLEGFQEVEKCLYFW